MTTAGWYTLHKCICTTLKYGKVQGYKGCSIQPSIPMKDEKNRPGMSTFSTMMMMMMMMMMKQNSMQIFFSSVLRYY